MVLIVSGCFGWLAVGGRVVNQSGTARGWLHASTSTASAAETAQLIYTLDR
jgi:hypothetical protein